MYAPEMLTCCLCYHRGAVDWSLPAQGTMQSAAFWLFQNASPQAGKYQCAFLFITIFKKVDARSNFLFSAVLFPSSSSAFYSYEIT